MAAEVRFHRVLTVLLTAALLATLTVALTGGQRADAVDGPVDVVYVATGRNFPDALAGANLAATVGAPLLTVEPDLPIPDTTLAALQSLDPDRIIVLGGPAAVSDAVVDALTAHARSGSVTRIEGTDRHDTAAQIADALPDKVHDADKLDGLDSSAFLRSKATIDADTLAGRTAIETRNFAVPWPDVVIAPTEHSAYGGLFHPAGMASSATFSVGLPPDRRAGEPLSAVFTFSRQQTPPCDIAVQVIGQTFAVDGSTKQPSWSPEPGVLQPAPGVIHADTSVFTVRFDAPPLADDQLDGPGAPLRLSMIRSGDKTSDTCGFLEVAGVTLSY